MKTTIESESHSVESDSLRPHVQSMEFSRPDTGMGSLSLLQGIFPTQGLNPGLQHCTWILYQLNHKGSQRILEWVAYPFSSGSSRPRNRTRVSCITGGFFTNWVTRESTTIFLLGWPKSAKYKLKTPNAEKDVEQQQFSVIITLSVKW